MPRKSVKASKAAVTPVRDPARKVWLAALGAVAMIKHRGENLLGGVIEEGRALQSRAVTLRSRWLGAARKRVQVVSEPISTVLAERTEAVTTSLEHGLGVVLGRLGVPSKADVAELSQRVSALSRQLRAASR